MNVSAARPPPRQRPDGEPHTARSALGGLLVRSGIALPVFIVAGTLFAVAADTDAADARALWIAAAAICAGLALTAWTTLLIAVHRR
ncbi:hypothetical protein [Embleya sp. NBC_00896]|uniref:hypothetical protein n=1 Tax=Embleya sp. NBC_00896 TaxID=2975961 RepID=UPI002F9094F4|nr:hypothetical protein OG928_41240 [Embleya sp. NBC_00896]